MVQAVVERCFKNNQDGDFTEKQLIFSFQGFLKEEIRSKFQ